MNQSIEQAARNELFFDYAYFSSNGFSHPSFDGIVYDRNTMINMFKKGAEWQKRQSPWISVEERLPDNDDDLYIVLDTKLEPPACGVCDFDLGIAKWIGAVGTIVHPTHWMPIPELPRKED